MGVEQTKPIQDTKEHMDANEKEEEPIEDKTVSYSKFEKSLIWVGLVGGTDLLTSSVVSGLLIYNEDIKKIILDMKPSTYLPIAAVGAGVVGLSVMGVSSYFYFKEDKTVEKKE